jgi:hypothetical protein
MATAVAWAAWVGCSIDRCPALGRDTSQGDYKTIGPSASVLRPEVRAEPDGVTTHGCLQTVLSSSTPVPPRGC